MTSDTSKKPSAKSDPPRDELAPLQPDMLTEEEMEALRRSADAMMEYGEKAFARLRPTEPVPPQRPRC